MTHAVDSPKSDALVTALANLRRESVVRIRELAHLRAQQVDVDAEVEHMESALFLSEPYRIVEERAKGLKLQIELAERDVKALGLDAYHADPSNKQPAPGVSIAVRRGVLYDLAAGLVFAKAKGLFLVPESLDAKALEKFLLVNTAALSLTHEITETPSVRLASDLGAALAVESEHLALRSIP